MSTLFGYDIGDWSFISDIFGGLNESGIFSGLTQIGHDILGQGMTDAQQAQVDFQNAQLAQQADQSKAELATRLEIAKLQAGAAGAGAGAAVKAAQIGAESAEKRAKLQALMDASGRRIDANFTGTGQKLAVIQDMLRGFRG